MKLTPTQQERIRDYLRAAHTQMADLPDEEQRKALAELKAQLREELQHYGDAPPEDHELETILMNCRPSAASARSRVREVQARRDVAEPRRKVHRETEAALEEAEVSSGEDAEDELETRPEPPRDGRAWLGVCAVGAYLLQLDPWVVRVVTVILCAAFTAIAMALAGMGVASFTLWAYLAAYGALQWRLHEGGLRIPGKEPDPLELGPPAKAAAGILVVGFAFYLGARFVAWGMFLAAGVVAGQAVEPDPAWGWLAARGFALFLMFTGAAAAFALLSAMPVSAGWDGTLNKLAKALLALYGVVISFGLASLFVGLVLEAAGEVTGVTPAGAAPAPF